ASGGQVFRSPTVRAMPRRRRRVKPGESRMPRDETSDVVLAFLIGAALGVGATLLMRSEDHVDARRVLRDLGVMRRRSRLESARDAGEEMVDVGRRAVATV